MPPADAVHLEGLTKAFGGRRRGLDGIDLVVPPGVVLGYLGPNGAGKSTTIRILMGLARATAGVATVLGLDAWADRDQLAHRVGYLPGDFAADPDLTADQYLRFMAELRGPAADLPEGGAVDALARRLGLDLSARIGALSHGNRQKVGLVRAFLGQPELLVLDEPTIGLDPLVQQEFLVMVREARERGATVFLSSHVLDEVQAVADQVAMIREGRLLLVSDVAELEVRNRRRLTLTFHGPPPIEVLRQIPSVVEASAQGREVTVVCHGPLRELLAMAAPYGIDDIATHEVDLEDVFLSSYGAVR
jgi:ABC-2 type transport system ATP-binding protein